MRLVVASSLDKLVDYLKNNYNVVTTTDSLNGLERLFNSTVPPGDTLLVTEKIKSEGSIVTTILEIHRNFPGIRIIYFAGGNLNDPYTVNQLNSLAENGIYDLCYGSGITEQTVNDFLRRPRLRIDCEEIFKAKKDAPVIIETENKQHDASRTNVFAVTSVKPGTGKSFVSSNLAVTLARFARNKKGEKANVLILEGDLQTLSVTTLFGVRDEEYNLKEALRRVEEHIENYGYKSWFSGAAEEKAFIKKCCLRTSVDHLYALEAHNYDFNDIVECDPQSYYYMLNYLSNEFDYIVVDCNSSLQHPTTDPIFQLAKKLYFVFTTDYNNIQLNVKFLNEIDKLGITDKVRFVLNRALVGSQKENYSFGYTDREIIGDKFNIDFEIPMIDMAVILNSTFNHKQIASDENTWTIPARLKFIKLAQDIAPSLTNLDGLYGEIAMLYKKNKKKK